MNIRPPRIGPQPWEVVRGKLDQSLPFANMRDTPYYRDAVWEQFSEQEYRRRYEALRAKMREHKLDAVIVPGGPSHWSFGGGMLWLTGHWEWHALASYVLVPLHGEPTMIYSMGGTHAEAVRRQVEIAVKDVRHSRGGRMFMAKTPGLSIAGLQIIREITIRSPDQSDDVKCGLGECANKIVTSSHT